MAVFLSARSAGGWGVGGGRGVNHDHQPANGEESRSDSTSCTLKEKMQKEQEELLPPFRLTSPLAS